MTVGAFYALLLLGPSLMQAIIDSYVKFGSMASGVPSITASNILGDGIEIAASLLIAAVAAGASLSVLTAALLLLCAVVIVWSFIKLVKGFVMAKIESFITIYAAVIQLGWGASRFTSIYAERYVASAMATGVKLMVFYFIVGVERALAPSWIAAAKQSPTAFAGFIPALTLTASIVLFCALAEPEKLAANIFGGQPQFTGHDVTNSYMPYVAAGVSIATSPALISSITGSTAAGGVVGAVDNAFHGSSGPGRAGQTLITLAAGASGGNPHPPSSPPPPPPAAPPPPPSTPPPRKP
jgi:type IV secretion system protein TrbL